MIDINQLKPLFYRYKKISITILKRLHEGEIIQRREGCKAANVIKIG